MTSRILPKALSIIRKTPLVGLVLRWGIRLYREDSVVRIWSGAAKGLRWRRHHRYDPSVWLGTYEPPIQQFLHQSLHAGDVFYDVGGHAGFFTVLAARLVGDLGSVVTFEPHPLNAESISEQIQINALCNVSLIRKAVSSSSSPVSLCAGKNLSMGYVGTPSAGQSAMDVEATTLDEILVDYKPPTIIKVDIEGGGVDLVKGAEKVAREHKPVWILEVHNKEEEAAFKNLLLPLGYRFESFDKRLIDPTETLPNHVIAFCD